MDSDDRLEAWVRRTEVPLLWLAGLAVGLYLLDLAGALPAGLHDAYLGAAIAFDVVFVVDLLVKLALGGRRYLATPWFVVDLVCALPVLSSLASLPSAVQALRAVRMFRLLRALRMLRLLRSLRVLRILQIRGVTLEQRRFDRAVTITVLIYSATFFALVGLGHGGAPGSVIRIDGQPVEATFAVEYVGEDGQPQQMAIPGDALVRTADELELWLVLGSLLGMGLLLVVSRFQIPALWSTQMRALLNVALPVQVAEHFLRHPDAYDTDVRGPATVVFCDLQGFTATVEALPLDEVKRNLEQAFDALVEAHVARDLIVDKYIGDAVMSFRGGNLVDGDPEEHAFRVVVAALEGQRALRALGNPYFHTVKIGGASATDALIGTFGTSRRLSYTILGDRVNLAARLEGSCNALGVSTLFCDQTRALLRDRRELRWREVGELAVQGKRATDRAWEAFLTDDQDEDFAWLMPYHRALAAYRDGRLEEAAKGFRETLAARPNDGPAARYLAECSRHAEDGLPPGWSAVLSTTKLP